MKQRLQRIGLILLMLAVLAYTANNYLSGRIDQVSFLFGLAFMGWLLLSQIYALIKEWKEK